MEIASLTLRGTDLPSIHMTLMVSTEIYGTKRECCWPVLINFWKHFCCLAFSLSYPDASNFIIHHRLRHVRIVVTPSCFRPQSLTRLCLHSVSQCRRLHPPCPLPQPYAAETNLVHFWHHRNVKIKWNKMCQVKIEFRGSLLPPEPCKPDATCWHDWACGKDFNHQVTHFS